LKTVTEDMDRIVVDDVSKPFKVVLREPSAAGFVWKLDNERELAVLSNRLSTPGASIGGSARRSFVLRINDEPPRQIVFRLGRPWEGTTVRSKVFEVEAAQDR
jgi:predicted secreted protein